MRKFTIASIALASLAAAPAAHAQFGGTVGGAVNSTVGTAGTAAQGTVGSTAQGTVAAPDSAATADTATDSTAGAHKGHHARGKAKGPTSADASVGNGGAAVSASGSTGSSVQSPAATSEPSATGTAGN